MDERAFLAAISANPGDDAPRLAYAGWLDKNGQPERAEFIRVECQAVRTDRNSPEYPALLRRSDRLTAAHAARWFGPLAGDGVVRNFVTRRGFVDTVAVDADGFSDRAEVILAHAPFLQGLHVTEGGDWRAFFTSPRLSSVTSLSFDDEVLTAEGAGWLATSDHTRALVELELDRQPIGPTGLAAVASARLGALRRLSASECGAGDAGVRALAAGAGLGGLRDLDLSGNDLTDAACRALAEAPAVGRLERLTLCDNHITGVGVSALAAAAHLGGLRELNLYANPVGPAGGRAILASRHWGGLRELNLIGCGVGVEVANDLRLVYGDRAIKV
jgi:uncharacterized protein (TIGR02996 family)